ncbi:IS3 family transposase [Williamwhitmania taraxaci]|uniref:Putative transposase n=1 Tax=Williamwhitmania taraxaci TaxID=1640674 RepID=A0A1G6LSR5_9BACT|nr:IS3 family transposase [Williamwhitmania taraxaci]SDC46290.1 putative transposase [Williamwhitmania taraxaci]
MSELRSYVSANEPLSVRKQCALLGINRSTLYYDAVGESPENLEVMRHMDEEFTKHPTHGVLQMQDFLLALSFTVNAKRIRRLLRKMGIMALYPRRNLSKLGHAKYIRPYLLRNLAVIRPNQVWAIDITYIPMAKGFMYMTAIVDVYSRYIVAWDVFNSLDAKNSLAVLKSALAHHGKPEIINSDQGSQFTCALWTEYVEEVAKIKISMDGRGRALDNIFIERFWRTVKQDYVYICPASDGTELYKGLSEFVSYYNNVKTHQGIGRTKPVDLYTAAA